MDIFGNFSKLTGSKNKRFASKNKEQDFDYSSVSLDSVSKIEKKQESVSVFALKVLVGLVFCGLVVKLFSLQLVLGETNQKLAEGNRIRPRVIESARGIITDNQGVWLVRNKPNFALVLCPADLPKNKKDREEIYQKLSVFIKPSEEEIKKLAEENGLLSLDNIVLKDNLSHDEALILEKEIHGLSGVSVDKKSKREYANVPSIAHILGYTGKVSEDDLKNNPDYFISDRIGKTGLEQEYEEYLRGTFGIEQIEVDSKGNTIRVLVKDGNKEPISGDNIVLYLNRDLQKKTAEALKKGIEEGKKSTESEDVNSGVAIVMDVKNGGILSMVSLPSYDNNLFATKISNDDYQKLINDDTYPMFDRAIKGTYPPGSIVKIVMAAAGLDSGVINLNTAFDTPPAIEIGEYKFPDWKDHGVTDIKRAIAESNNIFFYAIGGGYENIKGLGINNIKKYWQLFGLGEPTGIDLPGEASGLLPDPKWKEKVKDEPWYLGDTYHVSIGQGDLLVTPIQMLRITAAIANNGKLLNPQLVKKVTDSDGKTIKEFGPRVEREDFISNNIIKTIQEGMRLTVTGGSAQNLNDLPVTVAGKTGTAQFLNNQRTHAWFECYAPYENPEIAVIVMIEGGGGGHEIAAPVAKEILDYYFSR